MKKVSAISGDFGRSALWSEIRGWPSYCAVQQRYTYLWPRYGASFGPQIVINQDLKDYAQSHKVTLVAYSVLLGGAYSRTELVLPAQFVGHDSDARLAALRSVAADAGISVNQVILAWMRQSTPPVLPIIAGSAVEQLTENIAALDLGLSDIQMQTLNDAGNIAEKTGWIQPT